MKLKQKFQHDKVNGTTIFFLYLPKSMEKNIREILDRLNEKFNFDQITQKLCILL